MTSICWRQQNDLKLRGLNFCTISLLFRSPSGSYAIQHSRAEPADHGRTRTQRGPVYGHNPQNFCGALKSGRMYRKKYRERNSIQRIEVIVKVGDVADGAGRIYEGERV